MIGGGELGLAEPICDAFLDEFVEGRPDGDATSGHIYSEPSRCRGCCGEVQERMCYVLALLEQNVC